MATGAPAVAPRAARRSDRPFYTGMAVAVAIAVFVGFAPTFYLRPRFATAPLPLYQFVHGVIFTAWIVLFVAQTTLVAVRRTDVHRRLGWVGAGLAALVIVAGVTAGILSGRRDVAAGPAYDLAAGQEHAALTFLTVPLFSMFVFAVLAGAAVYLRRQTDTHKRLMLLATIGLLDAPLARWPLGLSLVQVYALMDLFIVAGVLFDILTRRRVNPAYLWGGLLIVAGQWLREVVGRTDAWHAFARVLLG